jgi:addiction module RelE/StbE family toxin
MEIRFNDSFRKQYKKADAKIKKAFSKRLRLFYINPHNPILRNHPLTGSYNNYRSINITGDWRAIYVEIANVVEFRLLGTHSQLYG